MQKLRTYATKRKKRSFWVITVTMNDSRKSGPYMRLTTNMALLPSMAVVIASITPSKNMVSEITFAKRSILSLSEYNSFLYSSMLAESFMSGMSIIVYDFARKSKIIDGVAPHQLETSERPVRQPFTLQLHKILNVHLNRNVQIAVACS